MCGIFLEYYFQQVLRFSSCLFKFTLLAAVMLFNDRVSAIVWKRNSVGVLLLRNCLLFSFMRGTFYCSGNDGLVLFAETCELPLFRGLQCRTYLQSSAGSWLEDKGKFCWRIHLEMMIPGSESLA